MQTMTTHRGGGRSSTFSQDRHQIEGSGHLHVSVAFPLPNINVGQVKIKSVMQSCNYVTETHSENYQKQMWNTTYICGIYQESCREIQYLKKTGFYPICEVPENKYDLTSSCQKLQTFPSIAYNSCFYNNTCVLSIFYLNFINNCMENLKRVFLSNSDQL